MASQTATRTPRADEAIPLGDGKSRAKTQRPLFKAESRAEYYDRKVEDLRTWAWDGRAERHRDELNIPALQRCIRDVLDHLAELKMDLDLAQDYKTPADYAELQSKFWAVQQRAERAEAKLRPALYLKWGALLLASLAVLVLTLAALFPA